MDFVLGLSPIHEDVTVTASVDGTETTFEALNAVTSVDSFDIARESAASFGDALRNEPGIAIRSFGLGANRPIIRGFRRRPGAESWRTASAPQATLQR